MKDFKQQISWELLVTGVLADLAQLYQRSVLVLGDFIRDCTTNDSPKVENQSVHKHKGIQLSMRQQKALAKAFFNPPKRNALLFNVAQYLRLLVE